MWLSSYGYMVSCLHKLWIGFVSPFLYLGYLLSQLATFRKMCVLLELHPYRAMLP